MVIHPTPVRAGKSPLPAREVPGAHGMLKRSTFHVSPSLATWIVHVTDPWGVLTVPWNTTRSGAWVWAKTHGELVRFFIVGFLSTRSLSSCNVSRVLNAAVVCL